MLIYETFRAAAAGEPGLVLVPSEVALSPSHFEADWGYRLRGGGWPGGNLGWLLTFAATRNAGGPVPRGWLIAYEINENSKTGRVAVLRRGWDAATDSSELKRIKADATIWDDSRRDTDGEADITVVDAEIAGAQL